MGQCLQSQNNNSNEGGTTTLKDTDPGTTKTLSGGDDNDSKENKKKKFTRRTSAHNGIMQSIAIKFPHIKRSFLACKEVFDKYATVHDEQHYINKSDTRKLLIELGAREADLTDEEVDRIIKTANLDGDEKIDFKEFLIAAAVGCFLGHDANGQSQEFLNIRKGFAVAEEAFNKIDKDGSGEIDFEELKTAFLAMRQDDLILERLKELDFNGDKTVEFPEFVWGLSAWVGMDEADDAEDTDAQSDLNLQQNSSKQQNDIDEINKSLAQNEVANES